MEQYISVLEETTNRQGFYAHTPDYFRKMWETLGNSGMIKIFNAVYEDTIIVSWIMFVFNDVLYYPYGASRSVHRDVMASNLMMWEMIRFGKQQGCHTFDMWGSLGPEPDKGHAWYGFHRFKQGYGGQLMEFVGTYDLVMNQPLYKLFSIADSFRWKLLRLRTRLPF
jgi:lipid II:glycine glycyltransferase (peptidoglycan interpeptide bridge formation enzyme)